MEVFISGTSQGIGRAIAHKFLTKGHDVVGFDVREATILHPRYRHRRTDIRAARRQEADHPQILVCNAGTFDEEHAIEVNLIGTMDFAEQFVPCTSLRSILFIASASARNGAEFPRYAASKAGIVGYMKNLALNVASRGITCNSISPGGVVTPANDHILQSEDLYAQVKAETLLGKWAEAHEIADLAYYLTVPNKSITGEDVLIDYGEMLKSNFIW